ncbi:MAG: YafY family protein [Pseudomonadota bacterium]
MRRTDRLFELIQCFRAGSVWRGEDLAERLGVSVRTIYRDIATLIASGVPIEGAAGIGYVLRSPIFLPPLSLSAGEMAALQFALTLTARAGDQEIAENAERLRDKISAVVPEALTRDHLRNLAIYAPQSTGAGPFRELFVEAIAKKRVLNLRYLSLAGQESQRDVRPLQLEYWGVVWTLTAWCELREDFRMFRTDRIQDARFAGPLFEDQPGRRYTDYIARFERRLPSSH